MGHANIDVTQIVYGKSSWNGEWMRSPNPGKPPSVCSDAA